jgi:hypothetical protein
MVHHGVTITIFRLNDCTRLGAFDSYGHATVVGIMEMAFHIVGRCKNYSGNGHQSSFQGMRLFVFVTGILSTIKMGGCDEFITTCVFIS